MIKTETKPLKHSVAELTATKIENDVMLECEEVTSLKQLMEPVKVASYTEMIARAIFAGKNNMSTLQEIYEYLFDNYPILKSRGKSWKNSVRHTLSLNEWFVKIPRTDNSKSCCWSIHTFYLERFRKGDFQKHRKSQTLTRMQHPVMHPLTPRECGYAPVYYTPHHYEHHHLADYPPSQLYPEKYNKLMQQSYMNSYQYPPPHYEPTPVLSHPPTFMETTRTAMKRVVPECYPVPPHAKRPMMNEMPLQHKMIIEPCYPNNPSVSPVMSPSNIMVPTDTIYKPNDFRASMVPSSCRYNFSLPYY